MECQCENKNCYENDQSSPSFCTKRDTCLYYDIHKDHERMEGLFWDYVVSHQNTPFTTVRLLPFMYQIVTDEKGRELVRVSRAKNPYTKSAVLGGLERDVDKSYYGQPYIQSLVEAFLGELSIHLPISATINRK